jgi:hypothetical protein
MTAPTDRALSLVMQMVKLARSLEAASEEERMQAVQLCRDEARLIFHRLCNAADFLRMLDGREPMLPHPEQ